MTQQWAADEPAGMPGPSADQASQAGEWAKLAQAARLGMTERSV